VEYRTKGWVESVYMETSNGLARLYLFEFHPSLGYLFRLSPVPCANALPLEDETWRLVRVPEDVGPRPGKMAHKTICQEHSAILKLS
jgi:hypothetical protein